MTGYKKSTFERQSLLEEKIDMGSTICKKENYEKLWILQHKTVKSLNIALSAVHDVV